MLALKNQYMILSIQDLITVTVPYLVVYFFEIQKVQLVQNAAAQFGNHSKKYHHITTILKELHWLPHEKRIIFKNLLKSRKFYLTKLNYIYLILLKFMYLAEPLLCPLNQIF